MMLNPEQIRSMKATSGFNNARKELKLRWYGEMPFKIDKATIKAPTRIRNIENAVTSFNKRTCGCFFIRYAFSVYSANNQRLIQLLIYQTSTC